MQIVKPFKLRKYGLSNQLIEFNFILLAYWNEWDAILCGQFTGTFAKGACAHPMNFLRFVWFYARALNCIIQLSAFIWLCGLDTIQVRAILAADTLRNVYIAVSSVSPVSFNGFNSPLMAWNCMSRLITCTCNVGGVLTTYTGRWKRNRINKWQV